MPANRPIWGLLTRRTSHEATATELYGRLVAQARHQAFYADLGVPDTPEGRLELIMLHVALMLRRFGREGQDVAPLAQALSEAFVTDMDDCLREMGVGDLAVAKKVKKAAAALFDRSRDYAKALEGNDSVGLVQLMALHIVPASEADTNAKRLATYARNLEDTLGTADVASIVAGNTPWPSPAL